MDSPIGGRSDNRRSTGSRFDIFNKFNENFPDTTNMKKSTNPKRRHPEPSFTTTSFFTKNSKLSDVIDGPKFILMKRNDNNSHLTLASVNPFLVVKVIENTAGRTKSTKLLRDGTLLIQTTSKKQADKLFTLKQLNDTIHVTVSEHPTLNQSKGTIFCRNILACSDDEIKDGLKEQHVSDVYRMKKKTKEGLVDTGLFVLTFDLSQLPTHIDAAYNLLEVREYVPNPRRCFNCQRYGHGAKYCKQQPGTCGNCAEVQHVLPPEVCQRSTKCPNCQQPHPVWDRKCPIFQHELNIQKIQTAHRISHFEARNRYTQSQPQNPLSPNVSFTQIIASSNTESCPSSSKLKLTTPQYPSESESDSSKIKSQASNLPINKIKTRSMTNTKFPNNIINKITDSTFLLNKPETPNNKIIIDNSQNNTFINNTNDEDIACCGTSTLSQPTPLPTPPTSTDLNMDIIDRNSKAQQSSKTNS